MITVCEKQGGVNMSKETQKVSYQVDDFHVVDFESDPPKKWYIREILDVTSSEFQHSELTNEKRIDIVTKLGVECMESLLAECFQAFHPQYSAADGMQLFIKIVGLNSEKKPTGKEKIKLELEAMLKKAMSSQR